ncbi:hypothetical protein AOLI_G00115330 [Acnodon oligacanthus]
MTPVYTTGLPSDMHSVYPAPPYGQPSLPPGYVPPQGPAVVPPPPLGYVSPQAPVMMPDPERPPGCPPGLEYLTQIDQLLVHQKMELIEAIFGWETNNQYIVKNTVGQQVFLAAEETDFCTRMVCGSMRSFVLHLQDNTGRLEVQAPPGSPVGYVMQNWHPYLPKFTIKNERGEAVLKIVGPFCDCNCCSDVNFEVMSLDEASVVGRISKQWTGMEAEMLTDADNFGVRFPMDLDVKIKAVILGACFLIDFMYFESSPKQDSHH